MATLMIGLLVGFVVGVLNDKWHWTEHLGDCLKRLVVFCEHRCEKK